MTLAVQDAFEIYNGNGSTDEFSIPFEYFNDTDNVEVILRNETVDPATEALQVIVTHYTINTTTDKVTMLTPPPVDYKLYIGRKMPFEQDKDFATSAAFRVEQAEDGLDRTTAMIQQIGRDTDRALKFEKSSGETAGTIGSMDGQAGAITIVNDDEDGLAFGTTLVALEASIEAAEDASAAFAANASASASTASAAAVTANAAASAASAAQTAAEIAQAAAEQAAEDAEAAAGGGITSLTGDVTGTGPGATVTTIANDAVSNAKLANVATQTIKGRTTASTGDPEDLTATQATAILNAFTGDSGSGGVKGMVPAPASGDAAANKFLKADGNWTATNSVLRGHIAGLTLSNAADANNDITVAIGEATDGGGTNLMQLAAAITKRLDANWTVGDNQGGLDTGSEANSTWYHLWLIKRSDTSVVDALFSTSATAPTMPANYDLKRRIGAVYNDGSGNILAFTQTDNEFRLTSLISDISATDPGTSAATRTVTVPTGVIVRAIMYIEMNCGTANFNGYLYVTALTDTDVAAGGNIGLAVQPSAGTLQYRGELTVKTNTSAQFRTRNGGSVADAVLVMKTRGWIDTRGRFD